MDRELSSSLLRHLKRSKIDLEASAIPMEIFREFLGRVDTSYEDFKERENRYEQICRQSSDEIANYISKLKQAESINKQQHTDIVNMLRHIKQGVFTLTEGRLIHPEYSAYTTEILGRHELAGCDVADVLLRAAVMDKDLVDQIQSALDFILGSESLSFETNQHILPRQLILKFPHDLEKTIEIDWTPIFNEELRIEKILVTVRDISEIRLLEKVNLDQQKELEILRLIMSTNKNRFEQFQKSSLASIEHCQGLLRKEGHNISIAHLQELYRDLHTIKGNARMFGFRGITNIVHEAEEHYKLAVHAIHESWNTSQRLKDLELIREELLFYVEMAEKAFGSGEKPEHSQKSHFASETLKILKHFRNQELSSEEALDRIEGQSHIFDFATLDVILENVVNGSSHLAKELGKLPPQVQIDKATWGFHRSTHVALESIFNHLIRNSLDHGIETEAERIQVGKNRRGHIHIAIEADEQGIQLRLKDDGRGLELNKIFEKAQSLGLLPASIPMTSEGIAQMIFEPGFSTKQTVSQVSGRGMGMSAVKSLIQGLGGDIRILFEDKESMTLILFLPRDQVLDFCSNPPRSQKAS